MANFCFCIASKVRSPMFGLMSRLYDTRRSRHIVVQNGSDAGGRSNPAAGLMFSVRSGHCCEGLADS